MQIDSRMLRLEITETALLVEPDKSDTVVSRLRNRGFLREVRDRERSRVILKTVIGLAEALGMDVITEGVETEQQLRTLQEMGCSYFQGYYFSRPVPVEGFEEMINRVS